MTFTIICLALMGVVFGCGGGDGAQPGNFQPTADAGADRIVNESETVLLDGSASLDPDGEIVSYLWVQASGVQVSLTDADTVAARFSAPVTGVRQVLVFQLTVWDDAGTPGSDTVTITVNGPPTVDAGLDRFAYSGRSVGLHGTALDEDGFVVEHLWEQIAGGAVTLSEAETPTPSFIAPMETGTLTFRYTVTDNLGARNSDAVSVHVSRVLFSDTFEASSGDWVVENDTNNSDSWSVESGEYFQKNNVNVRAFIESFHTGTYVRLSEAAFPPSATFRFSVDMTPRTNNNGNSDEGNDIGIMFPYAAATDYYRLTMNARYGFTRFEKRVGATFHTLAVNSIGYVDDQTINVTVEVIADTIVIMIDGDPVFAETDLAVSPGTVALYCQDWASFDNVIIAENSPQPTVVISSPLAHSVRAAPGDGAPLEVQAVVLNKPEGGKVTAFLDDGTEVEAMASGRRQVAWLDVTDGDHTLHAVLRGADGFELSRDINDAVGVGGNYIVAVGDSITNGTWDENPFNNDSMDGRIVSRQGFHSHLADRLTSDTGLPQIVFNEGIPRDRAYHLSEVRLNSILARHPLANKMILLIGTNDAAYNTDPNIFGGYVESAVNAALVDGIEQVFIARILPYYNENSEIMNPRVDALNAVIDNIVADGNPLPGPDFNVLFHENHTSFFSPDGIHPNDAGFQAMADAWCDSLALP